MTCQKRKVINVDKYHKSIRTAQIGAMSTSITTTTTKLFLLYSHYAFIENENRNEVKVREIHQQKNGKFFPL